MAEQNTQTTAGIIRRQRRRNVPKETSNILEQHYQTNPYPSRFDYLFISRNAGLELDRVKIWFTNRRRSDSRRGALCRNCRHFRAPIDKDAHDSDVRPRPCHDYWIALDQAKANNNNKIEEDTAPELPDNAPVVNANYAQHAPSQHQQLSTYVDISALFRFMEAWQRSCNESLPFYANQQFLMQQCHNTAPMWMNPQHFPNAANPYIQNAWINQHQSTMNRNYQQQERIHFNHQAVDYQQHGLPINSNDFTQTATGITANLNDHLN